MLKYLIKVFRKDNPDEMFMQITVPADNLFIALDRLRSDDVIIKSYILDED